MKTEPAITAPEVQAPVLPPTKLTPRQLRRARHRRTLRRFWQQFRQSKMGMIGLAILIFYAGVAIFSIFANKGALDPTITTNGPRLAGPSLHYPLGTQIDGISVLSLTIEGARISLFVGLAAALISMAARHAHRHVGRLQELRPRRDLDADHRRVPRAPLARAGDRPRGDVRSELLDHHHHHRADVVGRHRPTCARAGVVRQGTHLHRAVACARCERRARRAQAHHPQPDAHHLREHDPHDRDRDPV